MIRSNKYLLHHLTGAPMKELQNDKSIYSHGCLRKVSLTDFGYCSLIFVQLQKSSTIRFEMLILTTTESHMSVRDAKYQHGYQVLSEVQNSDTVCQFKGVMGKNGRLINRNDYVCFEEEGKVRVIIIGTKICHN